MFFFLFFCCVFFIFFFFFFFFQAEDGIRDDLVTGVQTCALPIFTGSLPNLTRDQAAKLIADAGGAVTSSVSKKTDYVVVGENPGSKLARAEALGIPILDEAGLRELTGG